MTEIKQGSHTDAGPAFGPESIAILPLGSTEPHGPHLPLDTDVILAEALARRTAELLSDRGVTAMVLPAIPYGVTRLAQDFSGGVTLRPGTLWSVVEDMVLSLQQDGVRQLLVCNAHREWEQCRTLANLASDYPERGEGKCQLLVPEGPALSEAECHGGVRETSLMLAVAPERMLGEAYRDLEEVALELPPPERGVNRSLAELGAERAYVGDPRRGTAEDGARILDEIAAGMVSACESAWSDLFSSR